MFLPDDGLAGEVVRSIAQTPDGALWFACWSAGISRYDGYAWKTYALEEGLPSKDVRDVAVDAAGRLWCGTTEGIGYWDGSRWNPIGTGIPGFENPGVWNIRRLGNGDMWFSVTPGQILCFRPSRASDEESADRAKPGPPVGEWSVALSPEQTGQIVPASIVPLDSVETWVLIPPMGILSHRGDAWQVEWKTPEGESAPFSLVKTSDGTVWGATAHALIRFDGGEQTVISSEDRTFVSLGVGDGDVPYLGTPDGLSRYANGRFEDIDLGYIANFAPLRTLFSFHPGETWAGTWFGAYRIVDSEWIVYGKKSGAFPAQIIGLYTDSKVAPVAADCNGRLFEWNGKEWTLLAEVAERRDSCIGISYAGNGRLWLLLSDGLTEFSLSERKVLRSVPSPVSAGKRIMYAAPSGRLFTCSEKKVNEYVGGEWRLVRENRIEVVDALIEDPQGALWINWSNGTEHETDGGWISLDDKRFGSPLLGVESMARTKDGQMLLGSAVQGVFSYRDGQISRICPFDEAFCKQTKSLFQAKDHTIWVGHRQLGISSYRNGVWRNFGHAQGLPVGRVGFLGEDPQGTIWALLEPAGVARYAPDTDPPQAQTDLCPATIPHGERTLLKFSAADKWHATEKEDLRFSMRITRWDKDGVASDWTPFGRDDYAVTPVLDPGKYALQVRAIDLSRNVSVPNVPRIFQVKRSPWQSPGLYVPMAAMLLVIVALSSSWLRKHSMIAEQQRIKEALQASEARFRGIVESSPMAMLFFRLEADGDLIFAGANPAADLMLRVNHENLIGSPVEKAFPALAGTDIPAMYRAVAKGELIPQHFETSDDDPRYSGSYDVRVFRTHPGFLVVNLLDISERRRAEANRQQLEEQLAQAQKMESIGRLAGGVAHDFNNILVVILGYGELLKTSLPQESPLQDKLREICAAGERARDLTRQLLAFSRKQVLDIKILDINQIVRNMETMVRRLLREDIELRVRFGGVPGRIKADLSKVEQILINLCVNARDAMPNGGTLTIETGLVRFDEIYTRAHPDLKPGAYVTLVVTDTGVGMDEETRRRVFDPFFTTKELGKGTGLGLATVYGIAKQHGGEILAYSEPGLGTTFRVCFPRVEDELPADDQEPGEDIVRGRGETILVVEDDPSVRDLTCEMLSDLGYSVVNIDSAEKAIEYALSDRPLSLLLTDVIMPEMNGKQLQERLIAIRPSLKTLFMSGYTEDIIGKHGMLPEGTHLISKPFSEKLLGLKLREVLDT